MRLSTPHAPILAAPVLIPGLAGSGRQTRPTRIPSAGAAHSRLEKDVLARSRKLERSSRGARVRRTAYGSWLLEAASPCHEEACRLHAKQDPPIAIHYADKLNALHLAGRLTLCAKANPAVRKIETQCPQRANESWGLEKRLLFELNSGGMRHRRFATPMEALGIVSRSAREPSDDHARETQLRKRKEHGDEWRAVPPPGSPSAPASREN